jgi:hypothetical protein
MENKYNIYDWIAKIIETCNNAFHFESVDKLIDLFESRFSDFELGNDLKLQRIRKWNEIHNVLT